MDRYGAAAMFGGLRLLSLGLQGDGAVIFEWVNDGFHSGSGAPLAGGDAPRARP